MWTSEVIILLLTSLVTIGPSAHDILNRKIKTEIKLVKNMVVACPPYYMAYFCTVWYYVSR
jgi:hypothetical protein